MEATAVKDLLGIYFSAKPVGDEDKAGFISALNQALITYGGGRYDYLLETPLTYVKVHDTKGRLVSEHVFCGPHDANVTGDSLIGMIGDVHDQLF